MAFRNGYTRTSTPEYKRLRRWALANLPHECAVPGCTTTTGLHLDHLDNVAEGGPDTADNVQWLCPAHHAPKTAREAARGRARRRARRRLPTKPHPGLAG